MCTHEHGPFAGSLHSSIYAAQHNFRIKNLHWSRKKKKVIYNTMRDSSTWMNCLAMAFLPQQNNNYHVYNRLLSTIRKIGKSCFLLLLYITVFSLPTQGCAVGCGIGCKSNFFYFPFFSTATKTKKKYTHKEKRIIISMEKNFDVQ